MKTVLRFLCLLGTASLAWATDPTPPDKYHVLIGEGLIGSAFLIQKGATLLAVTSLHQFDGKAPGTLMFFTVDENHDIILDKTKVTRQKDVQVLAVKSAGPNPEFLSYQSDFTLHEGDEVLIPQLDGGAVSGTLTRRGMKDGSYQSSEGPRDLEIKMSKPFAAAGGSGGPILSKQTGAVIGVLLTADDGDAAHIVGFETLCLPKP